MTSTESDVEQLIMGAEIKKSGNHTKISRLLYFYIDLSSKDYLTTDTLTDQASINILLF